MNEEHYFQFPLALLAYRKPWKEVAGVIAGYCIVEAFGREEGTEEERKAAAGKKLGVEVGRWSAREIEHVCAEHFLKSVPYTGSGDALVRVRRDILFESRDGGGVSEREFKILSAIYSALGKKDMRRITVDEIRCRAAGCVSHDLFFRWREKGGAYTPKQIRLTLEELHRRGFFARATYGRRLTYYSNRKTGDELRALIVSRHAKIGTELESERAKDAAMTAAVIERRKIARGQLKESSGATSGKLRDDCEGTAAASGAATHRAALIQTDK